MSQTESFHHAMIGVYEAAKQHDYFANYFKGMLDQYGGVETGKRLLAKREIQGGLMRPWEMRLVGHSMEALVIQEHFQPLFPAPEIAEAARRLEELGYSSQST